MFTGLIAALGRVARLDRSPSGVRLVISTPFADRLHEGDSIAVNGVCLTVVTVADGSFTADVMKETLDRSSLGVLDEGSRVNLERAVRLQDRLGGHLVQGHVDGVGQIVSSEVSAHWTVVRITLPRGLDRYIVEKGSITVDGVSLTVSAVQPVWFEVSLIPTTLQLTTLGLKAPGDPVNLEVDITAKYVEKLLGLSHE